MQSSSAPQRHLPIRKDWLAATQEPALEPDRPIIDPHHHLWDRPGNRYLFHDLMEDLNSGHNIRATVFLECREMYRAEGPPELRSLGETQFVAGVSAMSESGKYGPAHACAGIIGNVDFRVGSRAKGILEQHVILSGGRFRGIRNGATWHADPSLRVFTSGSGEGLYVDRAWRDATSPDELRRAVNAAMDSGKPTLINAVLDPAAGSESGRIGNLNPQSKLKKK